MTAKPQHEVEARDRRMQDEPGTPWTLPTALPMARHPRLPIHPFIPSFTTQGPGLPQAGHPHGSDSGQVRRPGLACKQIRKQRSPKSEPEPIEDLKARQP